MNTGRVWRSVWIAGAALSSIIPGAASLTAAVFPPFGGNDSHGRKGGVYMVIRDDDAAPLSQSRINVIRASEQKTRQFYAVGSGGTFDIGYAHVLDVPMALNADGTRPANYRTLAKNYVRSTYGVEPDNFFANIFDVNATAADANQGWAGVYYGGRDLAIQSDIGSGFGQIVIDHELGHRVGADHASAYRAIDDNDYTPYVYNFTTQAYEVYNSSSHGWNPTPYGTHIDEYGSPFDTMGNISNGAFRIREKVDDLGWLTSTQVPSLNSLGEGTYRIYAHDELTSVVDSRNGVYGVEKGYDAAARYGLTYTRNAERFNTSTRQFESYSQRIDLEYRQGRDGVQFYLDGAILDLDPEGGTSRGNQERELEVGKSIEDVNFGMSVFTTGSGGVNFLSFSPPAPTAPDAINDQWFFFKVLATGSNAVGSYVDLQVMLEHSLTGIAGDVNQDGLLNMVDVDAFRLGWRADTTALSRYNKVLKGDLNFNGLTDLNDWFLIHSAFRTQGMAAPSLWPIPEPASAALAVVGLAVIRGARRGGRVRR